MDQKFHKIKEAVEKELSCSAHNMDHVMRVYNLSLHLAENEDVDLDVLKASALLHDIARVKEDNDHTGKTDHAILSSEMAVPILKELDFSDEQIKHIQDCIISHRYRTGNEPKTKEAQILCQCGCGFEKLVYCLTLVKGQSTACFNCGHGNKGANNTQWSGHEEVPGTFISRIKSGAKLRKKGIEVNINAKDIYELWIKQNKKCALSGLPIDFTNTNKGNFRQGSKYDLICSASLDRIDSNKGYTKENIQLVHKDVNMIKKEYDQDYFLTLCRLITENIVDSINSYKQ